MRNRGGGGGYSKKAEGGESRERGVSQMFSVFRRILDIEDNRTLK